MAKDHMEYRAGRPDREKAEQLLIRGYEEGRLSEVEFSDRLEKVNLAVSFRDLVALVDDLPYDNSSIRPDLPATESHLQERYDYGVPARRVHALRLAFVIFFGVMFFSVLPTVGMTLFPILLGGSIFLFSRFASRMGSRGCGRSRRY